MRLALPKGKLLPSLLNLFQLSKIGVHFKNDRDYRPSASYNNLHIKLFKARSIPQLVALGFFDLGFCGHDLFMEAQYDEVAEVLSTSLNFAQLVLATSKENKDVLTKPPQRPLVIATEYELLASRWALSKNFAHIILNSRGSTESYPPEDADLILDCVESGKTLEANKLIVIEKLFDTTTVLIANKLSLGDPIKQKEIKTFIKRISPHV